MLAAGPFSVLVISHSYPPVIGGAEVETQRVCKALLDRGHRVRVLCAGGGPMPRVHKWTDPLGVPVGIYGGRWTGRARDVVFALRSALAVIRDRRRYQVVYFVMQGLQLAVCLPLVRALGKPIVMKVEGSGVIPLLTRSRTGRLELRMLRRWAGRIFILNPGMRDEAAAVGFPDRQLTWMPMPVDSHMFAPCDAAEKLRLRAQFGVPAGAPVAVYTGRLAPEKGLDDLLQAFALVAPALPEAILILVGDGSSRAVLEQKAAALGLPPDRVRFVGAVAADRVPEWLKLADVYAFTSPSEGFSCALAEAMASGLACLACDIPANTQLIRSGENGLLVPVGDAPAAASGLLQLLQDRDLRMRLGANARTLISDHFSTEQVVRIYERVFAELLNGAPRAVQAAGS